MKVARKAASVALTCIMFAGNPGHAQDMSIAWLKAAEDLPPTLSNLDPVPDNLGAAGAEIALADNATTGRFMGQDWSLKTFTVA